MVRFTVASATQGALVAYSNVLTNNGNGSDVFDVVMGAGTFPAGTTFTLYHSDGITPLTSGRRVVGMFCLLLIVLLTPPFIVRVK